MVKGNVVPPPLAMPFDLKEEPLFPLGSVDSVMRRMPPGKKVFLTPWSPISFTRLAEGETLTLVSIRAAEEEFEGDGI